MAINPFPEPCSWPWKGWATTSRPAMMDQGSSKGKSKLREAWFLSSIPTGQGRSKKVRPQAPLFNMAANRQVGLWFKTIHSFVMKSSLFLMGAIAVVALSTSVHAQTLHANIPYTDSGHERHVLDIYTPRAQPMPRDPCFSGSMAVAGWWVTRAT